MPFVVLEYSEMQARLQRKLKYKRMKSIDKKKRNRKILHSLVRTKSNIRATNVRINENKIYFTMEYLEKIFSILWCAAKHYYYSRIDHLV